MLGSKSSSEQLSSHGVFPGIAVSYFGFGFKIVTRRAEDLKIGSLVGAAVHERDDVVQGESVGSPIAHTHLRQRGPYSFAPTGFETAAHFSRSCIGRSGKTEGTKISA